MQTAAQPLRSTIAMQARWCCGFLLVALIATTGAAQKVAYTHATIETIVDGTIDNGTLIVDGDEIVDVGDDVDIPDDTRVVSLLGKTIMPGLIDPYFVYKRSQLATRTVTFRGRTFTVPSRRGFTTGSFNWVGKYFYPYSFNFRPAVRSGITIGNLVTDGRGLSALANIVEEPSAEMLLQSEGALFAQITNQTSAIDIIRKPLAKSAKKSEASKSKQTAKASAKSDPTEKYWQAVREGKKSIFVNINNAAGVAHLLKTLKDLPKVRVVLVATGPNLFQSLEEIKANKNVTTVLQPGIDRVPFKSDRMNVSRMLDDLEIPFAISMTLSSGQLQQSQDDPMFPLAVLVKNGLDRQKVLKSVTSKPAQLLGIEDSHGTLAKGKKANFLVFDGDPLETGSQLRKIFLNGKLTYEN